ncbi:amino acid ABC transporter permease [Cryptosporangium minutisporangium]|uniref:amino acid ABC transporter permease n=1 Tax=Cryptosporangium minutisporangium TaxID=113569 RepID=UPI0035E4E170
MAVEGHERARPEVSYVKSERQVARERYRRSRTLRSAGIAGGSSLIVVVALVVGIVSSPGWQRVRETFFSWEYAKESFPSILEGLWLNIRLLIFCGAVILAFGLLLALLRTLRGPVFFPLRALATIYTDLFRGLPVIITLLLMVYGVPALRLTGVTNNPIYLGGAALVLTYSAYVAEVFRAGIESVHPSQRAAARSLGLNWRLTMRYVVLPQAVRRVVPPLLNDLVSLQKDTGLVSIAGAVDAVYAAQIFTGQTFNYTSYVVAGLVFVALTIPMTRLTDWVTARMNRRQSQGGVV